MYNKVKAILINNSRVKGGDVNNLTPADNLYIMFSDLSDFIQSDFYEENNDIITKYQPVNKIFNAIPAYKPYRIVVRSMGDTYHVVYTIDADEDNFKMFVNTLINMGGVRQSDFGKAKSSQANIESNKRINENMQTFNRGISRGYQEGYNQQEQEFTMPFTALKDLF